MRIVLGFERCSKPKVRDVDQARGLFDLQKHGHVLTPGRYVGAEEAEDDGDPFEAKMKRLDVEIKHSLRGIGFAG